MKSTLKWLLMIGFVTMFVFSLTAASCFGGGGKASSSAGSSGGTEAATTQAAPAAAGSTRSGPTWTAVDVSSIFENRRINGITWGNNKFVAVGDDGNMAYSADGIKWTAIEDPGFGSSNNRINNIIWGNDKFVAVGGASTTPKVAYSSDGISWTCTTLDSSHPRTDIAWGNGTFVVVGSDQIMYSRDGISWTKVTDTKFGGSDTIHGIAWGGGKFVALGNSDGRGLNYMAYSTDGTIWTGVEPPTFKDSTTWELSGNGIAWGGNKFVAVGKMASTGHSEDGINWKAVRLDDIFGEYNAINGVAWGGNRFVAVGDKDTIAFSPDGITWTKASNTPFDGGDPTWGTKINGVAYGNNKFVAVADNGKMAYWQP